MTGFGGTMRMELKEPVCWGRHRCPITLRLSVAPLRTHLRVSVLHGSYPWCPQRSAVVSDDSGHVSEQFINSLRGKLQASPIARVC